MTNARKILPVIAVTAALALPTFEVRAETGSAPYLTPSDQFPSLGRPIASSGTWMVFPWKFGQGRYDYSGWEAEADAGRAQAAIYAGDSYASGGARSKTPDNCVRALEWYQRAHDLGSLHAAFKLGETYAEYGCAKYDNRLAIEWYSKSVELADEAAPKYLAMLQWFEKAYELSETYACVADLVAERLEPSLRPSLRFDATIRRMVNANLDDAARARAAQDAASIDAKIRARLAGYEPMPRVDLDVTLASPPGDPAWTITVRSIDDARECESNLKGNCRGVARLAYFEIENRGELHIFCRVTLESHSFPAASAVLLAREGVFAPAMPRRLVLGRITDKPGADQVHVECRRDAASGR
jgi:hypothetical protein